MNAIKIAAAAILLAAVAVGTVGLDAAATANADKSNCGTPTCPSPKPKTGDSVGYLTIKLTGATITSVQFASGGVPKLSGVDGESNDESKRDHIGIG